MDELILITGAARSGVSLIGGIVELCGAWGGQTAHSMSTDKQGSFENIEIRNSVVRPFLRGIKADPNGQGPLPELKTCRDLAEKLGPWWRQRIENIFTDQGYTDGPVFFANASSCLIWPIWAEAFPKARWILVRRSDEDIIQSCLKTRFMLRYKNRNGWQRWLDVHKWRFAEMISEGLNLWQVWPQRMIHGKLPELRETIENLKLRWDAAAVRNYITPFLWKKGVFEVSE